jgi:hypothetical protein
MMVYGWIIAGTLGLWSQLFKQYKCSNYFHTICMGIVMVMTWMSGFIIIINYGMHPKIGKLHVGLGWSIMVGIVVQGVLGIGSWACQKSSRVNPYLVYIINLSHRVLGYIMYFLAMI